MHRFQCSETLNFQPIKMKPNMTNKTHPRTRSMSRRIINFSSTVSLEPRRRVVAADWQLAILTQLYERVGQRPLTKKILAPVVQETGLYVTYYDHSILYGFLS